MTFKSKVDTWLLIVLLAGVSLCAIAALEIYSAESEIAGRWAIVAGLGIVGVGLPVWILASTYYVMTDTQLSVRCGPFKTSIPIRDIESVTPTRSPLSSPALSLDRLRIAYGDRRTVMISPEHQDTFLRQLQARRDNAA